MAITFRHDAAGVVLPAKKVNKYAMQMVERQQGIKDKYQDRLFDYQKTQEQRAFENDREAFRTARDVGIQQDRDKMQFDQRKELAGRNDAIRIADRTRQKREDFNDSLLEMPDGLSPEDSKHLSNLRTGIKSMLNGKDHDLDDPNTYNALSDSVRDYNSRISKHNERQENDPNANLRYEDLRGFIHKTDVPGSRPVRKLSNGDYAPVEAPKQQPTAEQLEQEKKWKFAEKHRDSVVQGLRGSDLENPKSFKPQQVIDGINQMYSEIEKASAPPVSISPALPPGMPSPDEAQPNPAADSVSRQPPPANPTAPQTITQPPFLSTHQMTPTVQPAQDTWMQTSPAKNAQSSGPESLEDRWNRSGSMSSEDARKSGFLPPGTGASQNNRGMSLNDIKNEMNRDPNDPTVTRQLQISDEYARLWAQKNGITALPDNQPRYQNFGQSLTPQAITQQLAAGDELSDEAISKMTAGEIDRYFQLITQRKGGK